MEHKSLDQLEKEYFAPAPSPFEYEAAAIRECSEIDIPKSGIKTLDLNGVYQMIDGGTVSERTDLSLPWEDYVPANIPCTVHTALYENGKIPDPLFAKNDKLAREQSYKTWWFKKEFDFTGDFSDPRLCFDGVCYNAVFWLNGVFLGGHIGMFGGPEFHIGNILKEHNTLIVKVENAPADPRPYSEYADHDEGWKYGVVVNCVYGWHYACIPSRGIWANVYIKDTPRLTCERPFIKTADFKSGLMSLCIKLFGTGKGSIAIRVSPYNFDGDAQYFSGGFDVNEDETQLHYHLSLKNHRLWWPNGYGEQPLYKFEISVIKDDDLTETFTEITGIRTIEMLPIPSGADEKLYNWTFNINGKSIFLKGTNWCTTDALLRFPNERYDRFLGLAKHQNLQLLRAWGGGMPESDYFYLKCDELGLMVAQEWPTCWDSQKVQPEEALVETALIHTLRLRNHPSLIQWAGGNESEKADGECMDKLARIAFQYDGTRPFHRTSPYGGSLHNYDTFWMMENMDNALGLRSIFMGEFGMASCPNTQSVHRYIPKEEWNEWDPSAKNSFNYHTPRFNEFRWPEEYNDMDHLLRRALEFCEINSIEDFVFGTQLAQATAIRHTLEAYRAQWPNSTGICYYKLTDVYPACSWATVDYYGVPKIPYYVIKNAYEPLHLALIIKSITASDSYPLYLFDDTLSAAGKSCTAKVTFLDKNLNNIFEKNISFTPDSSVNFITNIDIMREIQKNALIISIRLSVGDNLLDSTFYLQNYKEDIGCLRRLPKTTLKLEIKNNSAIITNTGSFPAVGVNLECKPCDTEFTAGDNFQLLFPNESREIAVNLKDNLSLSAFNYNS